MRSLISPYITQWWANPIYQHRVAQKRLSKVNDPSAAHVFIALDDPHSHIFIQALQKLNHHYRLHMKVHVIHHRPSHMFPEPEMWQKWASHDANLLADAFQLAAPSTVPKQHLAAAWKVWFGGEVHTLDFLLQLMERPEKVIADHPHLASTPLSQVEQRLQLSEHLLKSTDHFAPATLFHKGHWYWGVDRLHYFEQKLNESRSVHRPVLNLKTLTLGERAPTDATIPVVLYYSLRSPYSHLALHQAHRLCQHYGIPLIVKPVLPMLMRQLPVPRAKTQYLFFDALREAQSKDIPYGKIADPLGKGVENSYAIWHYANEQGKGAEWLLAISNAVNAQGKSANYSHTLKQQCHRIGLDWSSARQYLNQNGWRPMAEEHLKEMYELGCWGVPTLVYGDHVFWGQDRIWALEKQIIEAHKESA